MTTATTTHTASRRLWLYVWLGVALIIGVIATFALGSQGLLDGIYTDGDGLMDDREALATTIVTVGVILVITAIVLFTLRGVLAAMRDQGTDVTGIQASIAALESALDRHQHDAVRHGGGSAAATGVSGDVADRLAALSRALDQKADIKPVTDHQLGTNEAIDRLNNAVRTLQDRAAQATASAGALSDEDVDALREAMREVQERSRQHDEAVAENRRHIADLRGDMAGLRDELSSADAATSRHVDDLGRRLEGMDPGADRDTVLRLMEKERRSTIQAAKDMVDEAMAAAEENRQRVGMVTTRIRARSKIYIIMGVAFLVLVAISLLITKAIGKQPGVFSLEEFYLATALVMTVLIVALAALMFALADALRIIREEFA